MSMIGAAYLLSEERIEALLADPSTVYGVVDSAYNDPASGFVDLDKAWHCLHYLLTGSAWDGEPPLSFIVKGGTPVGEEDVGHGPARVFRAAEVAAIAYALASVDQSSLMLRLVPKRLEQLEIYPGRWSELNLRSDYELGYFFGPLEELKRLTARAKRERSGMIIWIT